MVTGNGYLLKLEFVLDPTTSSLFEDYSSEDIYHFIYYLCNFKGYGSLTGWQRQFLEDYARMSPKRCQFCNMPSNY